MSILPFHFAVLPIRTDRTLRAVPYATYTICFICLAVYFLVLPLSEYGAFHVASHWGLVVSQFSPVTLLTYGFVHTDLLHLLGNLLILWLVGTVLEAGIGPGPFLVVYFTSQVAAAILYAVIGWVFVPTSLDYALIGASGAIAGVTGFATFRYFRLRTFTFLLIFSPWLPTGIPIPLPLGWMPLWAYAIFFTGRELLEGIRQVQGGESAVAHWAHIGGLGLGVLAAVFLRVARDGRRDYVLEDSAKAVGDTTAGARALRQTKDLLLDQPNDPELLEAAAALMMGNGQQERARDFYLRAVPRFLIAGRTDRAAISYLNVLQTFPDTVLAARDQLLVAAALESMGRYPDATRAFLLAARRYAALEEGETALIRAATLYHRHLHNAGAARRLLQDFLNRYPHSVWRNLASQRLRELPAEPLATTEQG